MNRPALCLALGLGLGFQLSAAGQTASLLKDIAVGPEARFADPEQLVVVGNKLFLLAGPELWVTDGTALGTQVLGVLCTFPCSGSRIVGHDSRVLYLRIDGPGLDRLWRSDGTRRGTFPLGLPALGLPSVSSFDTPYAVAGGRLFFPGCNPQGFDCRLWTSDGSEGGTHPLKPGSFPGEHAALAAVGNHVFFPFGRELWRSDGTAAGTVAVQSVTGFIETLTPAGNHLFFSVRDSSGSEELWRSDGTAAGTRALIRFAAPQSIDDHQLLAIGDRLYFPADDVTHGEELWVSDGTAAGTRRLTEFGFNRPLGFPLQVQEANGRVFFAATDGIAPRQLWSVPRNATAAPAVRICGPAGCPEAPGSDQALLAVGREGGRLVFVGSDAAHGREPWATDGTVAGTQRLADVCPGPCSGADSSASPPVSLLGLAFFVAKPRLSRSELWLSDGTAAGTRRWTDPGLAVREPLQIAAIGRRLFFAAVDAAGVELWTSNGPAGPIVPVADLLRSGRGSRPAGLHALGERLVFFTCGPGEDEAQLWASDGTEATTVSQRTLLSPRLHCGGLAGTARSGGLVYFWKDAELWRTDGTAAGTFPLAELLPAPLFRSVQPPLAGLPDRVLTVVSREEGPPGERVERLDLWVSDGSPAGTRILLTLPDAEGVGSLWVEGSEALFLTVNPVTGRLNLWLSNGTLSGTRRITFQERGLGFAPNQEVRLGSALLLVSSGQGLFRVDDFSDVASRFSLTGSNTDLIPYHGAAYFLTNNALWRTDGTGSGTREVHAFGKSLPSQEMAVLGDRLFFLAVDAEHGAELWQSDGTTAGTALVRDIAEGDESSNPRGLTAAGGRLYFTAFDRYHGTELWQSDGTAAGTRLVQDLAPGPASPEINQLTPAPGRLYFSADDGVSGQEPWVLPFGGHCEPSATRLCLNGGRFQVESAWKDFSGNTGTGKAVALTGDTGYFWFFDPANVELVTKVLDAEALNQHFWVFFGALSSVEYTLTVTDTQTGASRRYTNFSGQLASAGDTQAFGPLGAFSQTPSLAAPLPLISERSDLAATAPCVPGPRRLCLNGGRFAVTANWKDFQNRTGPGTAVGLTGDTGYFWFFDPANVEVVLKVLDGRGLNGKFWTFYGALSNVEYTLTVTDTQTGAVRTYANPSGRFASVADTGAF